MPKINYFSNSIVPSNTANAVHVTKMADALETNGNLNSFFLYKKKHKDIKSFYNLKNILNYKQYYFSPAPVFNTIDAVLTIFRTRKKNITYGRNIKVCIIHAFFNRKVIFETHQPLNLYPSFDKFLIFYLIKKKKLNQIICISSALKKIIENEIKNCDVEINVLHDATTPKKKKN